MLRKISALLATVLCLGLMVSCSQAENNTIEINNDTPPVETPKTESDTQSSQTASELEPPLTEKDITMAVPEFLTEEQQLLYRRACSIFPAFSGYPFQIDEYPTDVNTNNYHSLLGDVIETNSTSGIRYYYAATGRYKRWHDFVSMGTSIFTHDYFAQLSYLFLNIDGYTYIPDVAKGGRWGYLPQLSPDTFNLISRTDTEIRFEVVGHYFDTCNIETANPNSIRTESFPITMVLTNNGWRFSEFNSPA